MTDLNESIRRNLDKSRRARRDRFRSKKVSNVFKLPQNFPPLEQPKHGAPSPIMNYPYVCGQMDWTKRDWWRFKRACYAQGIPARQVIRILCQQYVEDYEATCESA